MKKTALILLLCVLVGFAFVSCKDEPQHEHAFTKEVAAEQYLKSAATCTSKAVYYKSCECGEASSTDTFEYGELAAHVYDKEVVDAKYLKSAASCISKAVYYKSCECGAAGTETFEAGELGDHEHSTVIDDDCYFCAVCGRYIFTDPTVAVYNAATDTTYTDLQTAMDDCKGTNCTLYLCKDITGINKGFYVDTTVDSVKYSMTIDLCGFTVDGTGISVKGDAFYYGTFDLRGGLLTLKNGTVKGNANTSSTGVVRASNAVNGVVLENLNIIGTATGSYNYAVLINKTNVTINNTDANTIQGAVKMTSGSTSQTLTINGGSYTTYSSNENVDYVLESYAATKAGSLVINGGTYNGLIKINDATDQSQLAVDTTKYIVTETEEPGYFSIVAK